MKRLLIAIFALTLTALHAKDGDFADPWSTQVKANYTSSYFYRAQKRSNSGVQTQIEGRYAYPDYDVYGGFFANAPFKKSKYMGELDPYIGMSKSFWGLLTLDTGLTYYHYYGYTQSFFKRHNSAEAFFGGSFSTFLSPALYFYYDPPLKQNVVEGSITYPLSLKEGIYYDIALESGLALGYLHAQKWQKGIANHYAYFTLKEDLVYTFRSYARFSVGLRLAANTSSKNSLTNTIGHHSHMLGFVSSFCLDF